MTPTVVRALAAPLRQLFFLSLLLFFVGGGIAIAGAGFTHFGKRFLVTFPDTSNVYTGKPPTTMLDIASIVLTSTSTARVTITTPGISKTVTVTPSASVIVSLTDPAARAAKIFFDLVNLVSQPQLVDITSDKPISVYCYFATPSGCEGFTPLPIEQWGTEYYAMGLPTHGQRRLYHKQRIDTKEEGFDSSDAPAQIIVIASEDGTSVTIDATDTVIGNRSRTISLDAGQAYSIETWGNDSSDARDLSGTHIVATKPIGVISGNTRCGGGSGWDIETIPTGNSANNSIFEWLAPVNSWGSTFVYAPIFNVIGVETEELIRIYAMAPGTTRVTSSDGILRKTIEQGSFVQFTTRDWCKPNELLPMAFYTDKPAQAMVVSGSYAQLLPIGTTVVSAAKTWGPAMTLMEPYGGWITIGRFYSPALLPYMNHYLVVMADTAAQITVDGKDVTSTFRTINNTPFKYGKVNVSAGDPKAYMTAGDHVISSNGGAFTAIAYGSIPGNESVRAAIARKGGPEIQGGAGSKIELMHPTEYIEDIAICYGYPVIGDQQQYDGADSLTITSQIKCDSTTFTAMKSGTAWMTGVLDISLDPTSTNTDLVVTPILKIGIPTGYKIRFTATNPDSDAVGSATIRNLASGQSWNVPYSYVSHPIDIQPDSIFFTDVFTGRRQITMLTLTNRKPFTVTLFSLNTISGSDTFGLENAGDLPYTFAAGETIKIPIYFKGAVDRLSYHDSLVVETDCRSYPVAVTAGYDSTAIVTYPIPRITGYDWAERRIHSNNDTLSFLSNVGDTAYIIARVTIISDTGKAFSLTAPNWQNIKSVLPAQSSPLGIRFTPPREGDYTAEIEMVTIDSQVVHGRLHGVGVEPRISVSNIWGSLCLGTGLDTTIAIVSTGTQAATIDSIELTRDNGIVDITIDTTGLGLPRRIPPGDTLWVKVHLEPITTGLIEDTLLVRSDVTIDGTPFALSGLVIKCGKPVLVVDDHDFDTLYVTLNRDGYVTLRNLGEIDVNIMAMRLMKDSNNAFTLPLPTIPFMVPGFDSVRIDCSFSPALARLNTALIRFDAETGTLYSKLQGVGKKLVKPALIPRKYHAAPGEEVNVYMQMQQDVPILPLDSLNITIGHESRLLALREVWIADSTIKNAKLKWNRIGDSIYCHVDMGGDLPKVGNFIGMRFLTRFSLLDSSAFPFTIVSPLPYLGYIEQPGLFLRDPICGLSARMFVTMDHGIRLDQNVPNPASGATSITFEIPFEDATSLIVYDALGSERKVLVNQILPAGAYTYTIAAGELTAGVYEYRLKSGEFTKTRRMVIQ